MNYFDTYLGYIKGNGNPELSQSIKETVNEISKNHLENFDFLSSKLGLLFGNVQSGKTGQMFGIIAKAADLGFSVFLILTTDNISLQQQTMERAKDDLSGFSIYGENDGKLFGDSRLDKPAIIILKKNARVLKQWSNILQSTQFLKGNPLMILDDEADAASLNTLVNQNERSSINTFLSRIRQDASSSLYLQITGTPQAVLLQSISSRWKPEFACSFKPGKGYLGGDFFFPASGKPDIVDFISQKDNKINEAILHHLACSALLFSAENVVCNALFHPGVRVQQHEKTAVQVLKAIDHLKTMDRNKLKILLEKKYNQLKPSKFSKCPFEQFWILCLDLLDHGRLKIIIMNGKNQIQNSEFKTGSNIIIGGNSLGRGVTFPALQTIYYTRTAKNPQADTMWQHSRMFGYDRDPGLVRLFIDPVLYKLFSDINTANHALIRQLENGQTNIAFCYPDGLSPSRKNVIDQSRATVLLGGTNYYPADPSNPSFIQLDTLLNRFDDSQTSYQVSLKVIRTLLSQIQPSPDFHLSAFLNILDSMLSSQPAAQGRLIVRRQRKITQGTGALLSPKEWDLNRKFEDQMVLTMYKIEGGGWKSDPIWVPNIHLPSGKIYIQSD